MQMEGAIYVNGQSRGNPSHATAAIVMMHVNIHLQQLSHELARNPSIIPHSHYFFYTIAIAFHTHT
jgi:hypothetical protein